MAAEPASSRPSRRKSVLIVDDEPTVRLVLTMALEGSPYAVMTAADGQEALEAAHRFVPDLIILDIGMPGIDGLEVCRRLKADPATQGIKIVILTARAREDDRRIGLAAGADGYLTKPFSPRAVLEYIERELGDLP